MQTETRVQPLERGKQIASYVATALENEFPVDVLDAAKRALVDFVAVAIGTRVRAQVHPNALITAGKRNPRTPLEGKFSVPFCVAMSLRGHRLKASDFNDTRLRDASVMEIVPTVELEAVEGQPQHEAHLDVYLEGGEHLHADTALFLGHPDNPMTEDDTHAKFNGLVEPMLGADKAKALYDALRRFESPGALRAVMELLARPTLSSRSA